MIVDLKVDDKTMEAGYFVDAKRARNERKWELLRKSGKEQVKIESAWNS